MIQWIGGGMGEKKGVKISQIFFFLSLEERSRHQPKEERLWRDKFRGDIG